MDPKSWSEIQLEQQIAYWREQQKKSSQILAEALKERKRRNKERRSEK